MFLCLTTFKRYEFHIDLLKCSKINIRGVLFRIEVYNLWKSAHYFQTKCQWLETSTKEEFTINSTSYQFTTLRFVYIKSWSFSTNYFTEIVLKCRALRMGNMWEGGGSNICTNTQITGPYLQKHKIYNYVSCYLNDNKCVNFLILFVTLAFVLFNSSTYIISPNSLMIYNVLCNCDFYVFNFLFFL